MPAGTRSIRTPRIFTDRSSLDNELTPLCRIHERYGRFGHGSLSFLIPDDAAHELLRLIMKCKPHDKICLVTDSMRGAGLPDGQRALLGSLSCGQDAIIQDGGPSRRSADIPE